MSKNNVHLPDDRYADLHDIENAFLQSNGIFLVAHTADGQLVGMGGARRRGQQVELKYLRVHPGHQNKGIGANILQQLEDFARHHDCPVTHLSVLLSQTETQRFFLQHGYYFVNRDKVDSVEVVFFEKQLDWNREPA